MTCSEAGPVFSRPGRRHRKNPFPGPPEIASKVLYAEIPRNQIGLCRFLLEGYDNLAIMSVVDRYRAVIKLRFLSDAERTLRGLLEAQGAGVIELPERSGR